MNGLESYNFIKGLNEWNSTWMYGWITEMGLLDGWFGTITLN